MCNTLFDYFLGALEETNRILCVFSGRYITISSFLICQRSNTVCFLGVQGQPTSAEDFGFLIGGKKKRMKGLVTVEA